MANVGDRSHQAMGIWVLGRADDFLHRADLGNTARIHHGDTVRSLGDHAHVMGHQHHGGAMFLAQPLQQRDDLRLDGNVQRRGRLVRNNQAWLRT